MNLPTEITLHDLYYTRDLFKRVNSGELVARIQGNAYPILSIAHDNVRYKVWFTNGEKPLVYRGNKRVVISAE